MTEQEKTELFQKQINLLNTFLHTGAISREQYEISYTSLVEKMGIEPEKLPKP